MDHIRGDCSASEKIIKKLSLVGASITHYTLATSLILQSPSLISFSKINDTVKPGSLLRLFHSCWSRDTFSVCEQHARQRACGLIWRFHIARLVGIAHSFSAAHNSCPVVRGSTAVLTVWVTLDKTPSVGPAVLTALRSKSWLLHGPATGILDTFPEPVSLAGKQRLGPASQGLAYVRSFAPGATSNAGHHHTLSCSPGWSYQLHFQEWTPRQESAELV